MKNYKISEQLAQAIVNYLGTKPFIEVFQFIEILQKLEEIIELTDKDKQILLKDKK